MVKKKQVIGSRSPTALQALYLRDPDLVNLVQSYIPYDSFSDDEMEVETDGGNQPKAKNEPKVKKEGSDEETSAAGEKMEGVDGHQSDLSDETDTDDEKKDHYHGGETDANLEDSSDDEYDDMRPAPNPTGAVLVPAS